MIRISIAFFYGVGAAVRPLRDLKPTQKMDFDYWLAALGAQQELEAFLSTPWFLPAIKTSYAPGQRLVDALKVVTNKKIDDEISAGDVWGVTSSLTDFETVLRAELSIVDAYFVTRKGGYDTFTLIANAETIFPADLTPKVPQAVQDVREAGRCLAYELSTASGFHVLRATESVIRRYWEVVSSGKPHPKPRNMGTYIHRMEKAKMGAPKVLAVLKQIKDLHRNPLAHPEETLNLQDAIGLFGIAHSAIGAMLKEIPTPPSAPSAALASS